MASSNPETVDLVNRSVLDEIPLVLGKLSLTEAQQSIVLQKKKENELL